MRGRLLVNEAPHDVEQRRAEAGEACGRPAEGIGTGWFKPAMETGGADRIWPKIGRRRWYWCGGDGCCYENQREIGR